MQIRGAGAKRGRGSGRPAAAIALCVAVAGVWSGGSSGFQLRPARCTPGPTKLAGADVSVFCGPARATVRVAGKTYRFAQGVCQKTEGFTEGSKALTVNIGTQTLPPAAPKASYFGVLTDKARGGRYVNQAVSWQVPGKGFAALTNTVVVGPGLEKGGFSGQASMRINGRVKDVGLATGSWIC